MRIDWMKPPGWFGFRVCFGRVLYTFPHFSCYAGTKIYSRAFGCFWSRYTGMQFGFKTKPNEA